MITIWLIFLGVCFVWFAIIIASTNDIRKDASIPMKKIHKITYKQKRGESDDDFVKRCLTQMKDEKNNL